MKAQEELSGQTIDRYQIIEHLARGGMADVYVARDVELQRLVALKIMSASLAANSEYVERFRREAQAVARLEHPNIVQIFSAGVTSSGRPYLAMQYIGGGSLQERIQELQAEGRAFSSVAALSLSEKLADALEVAHRAGIVHRDIKPSNILLRQDGEPVLVDLGIAAIEGATRLTRAGNLVGTPHYMSPEQVRGLAVDGRSDIYSLGIILYEMLAGKVPFDAPESLAILHQHVSQAPPDLNELRPGLSAESYEVVRTCLAKDPNDRYQSAAAFRAAIASAIAAEQGEHTAPAIPPTARVSQAPLAKRRRLLALVAILFLLVPLSFLAFGLLTSASEDPETNATVVTLSLTITSQASFASTGLNNPEPGADLGRVATSTFAPVATVADVSAATSTVAATTTLVPSPTLPPPTETIAPTATTAPTATFAPTATLPPTPVSCTVAAASNFFSRWEAHREQIGCATAAASSGVSMAEEPFERGRMFWRGDNDQIYAVYSSGTWAGYDDIWYEGDPSFSCGTEQSPPTPQRGFGKIWCTYGSVQQGLGNATEAEYAVSGTVQNFDSGFMLQTSSGRTYVFFYDGTWR